jgi:hypothetical protein
VSASGIQLSSVELSNRPWWVYPSSGESWDADARGWIGAGARLVGDC